MPVTSSGELKWFNAALVDRWRPANSEVPERNLNLERQAVTAHLQREAAPAEHFSLVYLFYFIQKTLLNSGIKTRRDPNADQIQISSFILKQHEP